MWTAPVGTWVDGSGWTVIGHTADPHLQIPIPAHPGAPAVEQVAEMMQRARAILTIFGVPEDRIREALQDIAVTTRPQPRRQGHLEVSRSVRRNHADFSDRRFDGGVLRSVAHDECTGADTRTEMPSTGRGDPFADLIGRIDEVTG